MILFFVSYLQVWDCQQDFWGGSCGCDRPPIPILGWRGCLIYRLECWLQEWFGGLLLGLCLSLLYVHTKILVCVRILVLLVWKRFKLYTRCVKSIYVLYSMFEKYLSLIPRVRTCLSFIFHVWKVFKHYTQCVKSI